MDEAERRGFLGWKGLVGALNDRGAYVWSLEATLATLRVLN
jgi:hypothetical protein